MLAVTVALIAGFLLGGVSTRSKLRRTRIDLHRTRWLAEHDPLTGLPNRAGALRRHQLRAAAGRADVAVLLDLDGFKAVNDTWGHQAGDAHLAAVADRLAAFCAPLDAVACRLAGDEFLLLLPGADPQIVVEQVTALLGRLREPMVLPLENAATVTLTTTASAGIAFPEPSGTWAELLRKADIALYQAKIRSGRAVLHAPGMCQPPLRETDPAPRLREQHTGRQNWRISSSGCAPRPGTTRLWSPAKPSQTSPGIRTGPRSLSLSPWPQ